MFLLDQLTVRTRGECMMTMVRAQKVILQRVLARTKNSKHSTVVLFCRKAEEMWRVKHAGVQ